MKKTLFLSLVLLISISIAFSQEPIGPGDDNGGGGGGGGSSAQYQNIALACQKSVWKIIVEGGWTWHGYVQAQWGWVVSNGQKWICQSGGNQLCAAENCNAG